MLSFIASSLPLAVTQLPISVYMASSTRLSGGASGIALALHFASCSSVSHRATDQRGHVSHCFSTAPSENLYPSFHEIPTNGAEWNSQHKRARTETLVKTKWVPNIITA